MPLRPSTTCQVEEAARSKHGDLDAISAKQGAVQAARLQAALKVVFGEGEGYGGCCSPHWQGMCEGGRQLRRTAAPRVRDCWSRQLPTRALPGLPCTSRKRKGRNGSRRRNRPFSSACGETWR